MIGAFHRRMDPHVVFLVDILPVNLVELLIVISLLVKFLVDFHLVLPN